MVSNNEKKWISLIFRILIVVTTFSMTGCAATIAESIIEKSVGKEVLLFTQARYGELEQYMEEKMKNQASISSSDQFFLCAAYAKVKRYNKLFACVEQSERLLANYQGPSLYNLTPETIRAYSSVQRAEALIDLGDYPRALRESERAYALSKAIQGPFDTATGSLVLHIKLNVLSTAGLSQALSGNREAAKRFADALEQIVLDPRGKSLASLRSVGVARIYTALGDYRAALNAVRRYEESGLIKPLENLTNVLAGFGTGVGGNRLFNFFELPQYFMKYKLLLETGNLAGARQGYESLLKVPMIEENGGLYWIILFDRGRIAEQEGDLSGAIEWYRRSINVIESQRSTINTESSKIGFVGDKQDVYRRLIAALHTDRQYASALEYVERSKARTLVDMLAMKNDFAVQAGDEQQMRALVAEGSRYELEGLAQDAPLETSRMRGLSIRTREQLGEKSPELASLVTVAAPTIKDIQGLLPEDETLLEYYYTDKDLYVFVLNRLGLQSLRLDGSRLDEEIREFRRALASPATNDCLTASEALYRRLIRPVADMTSTNKLLIVAHGALHYLPFAALFDGTNYTLERYSIRMLPSAGVIKYLSKNAPKKPLDILILGNPDLNDPLYDLAYAQNEAIAIAKLLPHSKIMLRKDANVKTFETFGPNARYIHFASHGEFNADSPLKSALLLAKDAESDGRLTVDKLYTIKLDAELVTLSACETGLGKIANGDDVVGLSRGFLYAGSNSIVASLWKVDDEATSHLMVSFYGALSTMDKREALRQAQMETKKKYKHPYYWASFQITGNAN